jgi:hypothetical protein
MTRGSQNAVRRQPTGSAGADDRRAIRPRTLQTSAVLSGPYAAHRSMAMAKGKAAHAGVLLRIRIRWKFSSSRLAVTMIANLSTSGTSFDPGMAA